MVLRLKKLKNAVFKHSSGMFQVSFRPLAQLIRALAAIKIIAANLSYNPSINFKFCTAAPDAPLPRLSSRATSTAWR